VLALVAVLAIIGCGSESELGSLEQAATKTEAGTSRFETTYGDDKEFGFLISGRFDYAGETGVITLSKASEEDEDTQGIDDIPEEVRFIGDAIYLAWTLKGKTYWVREDGEPAGDAFELLVPVPGGASNPTTVLPRVLRASVETRILGGDEVRGAETTHYRAKVDMEKLIAELPAAERPDETFDEERFVPVELWIDDENRLRRIRLIEETGTGGGPAAIVTAELFDFGVEVDVEAPPADQLISQEELDRLIEPEVDPAEMLELCKEEIEPEVCAELQKESK
jgi:hypothetical protein